LFELGWISLTNDLTISYSFSYFDVLHHLCAMLSSRRHISAIHHFQKIVFNNAQLGFPELPQTSSLQNLPVEQRHALIAHAVWLLQDWSDRLISPSRQANCSCTRLIPEKIQMPFWFLNEMEAQLSWGPIHHTEHELATFSYRSDYYHPK